MRRRASSAPTSARRISWFALTCGHRYRGAADLGASMRCPRCRRRERVTVAGLTFGLH